MKTSTIVIILFMLAAIAALCIVVGSTPVNANEFSDFNYAIAHQDNPRNVVILKDLVYEFGTMDKLIARMNADALLPPMHVATDAFWNPVNGTVEYSGVR
jgi:hypothetical protein